MENKKNWKINFTTRENKIFEELLVIDYYTEIWIYNGTEMTRIRNIFYRFVELPLFVFRWLASLGFSLAG